MDEKLAEYGCSVIPSVVGGPHETFPVPDLDRVTQSASGFLHVG